MGVIIGTERGRRVVTSTDGTWSGKGSFIRAGSTALVENTHRLTKELAGRKDYRKGREEYI